MLIAEYRAPPADPIADATAALEELSSAFGVAVLCEAFNRAGLSATNSDPFDTRRIVQYILREIVHSDNPQLEAEIMAIASGVLDEKGIETQIAAKNGVCRQAVSKRVVSFADKWGLSPSAAMKSLAARQTFSVRNQPRR